MIPHEDHNSYEKVNDIALLRLKKNVIFKDLLNVATICLPVRVEQIIDNIAEEEQTRPLMTISGWGYTEKHKSISDVLMHAAVPYLDQSVCKRKFKTLRARFAMIDFDATDIHLVKSLFYLH